MIRHLLLLVMPLALAHGQARMAYEVVSIKPSSPGGPSTGIKVMPGGQEYRAQSVPLRHMIALMHWTWSRQITGGPDWLDDRWDIDAKANRSYTLEEHREMFRNLLEDEFKLKLRREVKEGPVYALMLDRTGSKMKVNEGPEDFELPIRGRPPRVVVGKRVSMQLFCWQLGVFLEGDKRPVIDKTGLAGYYDFTLSYRPPLPSDPDVEDLPPEMAKLPSLFDALKRQLGLRLEAQKGPVEYFVVEHVEKPTGN
jgi:uncharacterized protein (TIGR03435 family)